MKILKEEKEQLPISFITDFVGNGWNTVGALKDEIKSIRETFANTEKIEKVLQDLIDSYLICMGQLELYLHNNNYLDTSSDKVEPIVNNIESPTINNVEKISDLVANTKETEIEADEPDCFNCEFEEPELTAEDKANYEDSTKVL